MKRMFGVDFIGRVDRRFYKYDKNKKRKELELIRLWKMLFIGKKVI
jgi:hypothetical protein